MEYIIIRNKQLHYNSGVQTLQKKPLYPTIRSKHRHRLALNREAGNSLNNNGVINVKGNSGPGKVKAASEYFLCCKFPQRFYGIMIEKKV